VDCLSRLQLDYLDLFIIHWPVSFPLINRADFYPKGPDGKFLVDNTPIEDTWKAMEDLLDTGLVRAIGVSNMTVRELDRVLRIAKVAYFLGVILSIVLTLFGGLSSGCACGEPV